MFSSGFRFHETSRSSNPQIMNINMKIILWLSYVKCHKTNLLAWISLQDSLAQVVEHHDVGVHVEQVVGVRRVVVCSPGFRPRAFVRKHVVAVFGLIIHAVESCYLQHNTDDVSTLTQQTWFVPWRTCTLTLCFTVQGTGDAFSIWIKRRRCSHISGIHGLLCASVGWL